MRPYINFAASGGGGGSQPPITTTASLSGQTVLFPNVTVLARTIGNPSTGVELTPLDSGGSPITSGLLTQRQRLRYLIRAVQPSPGISSQPADSWALPDLSQLVNSDGTLDSTYFQVVRRLPNNSGPDPDSAFLMLTTYHQLTNFNTVSQQPTSGFDNVSLELWAIVVDAVTLEPVTLENNLVYDFIVQPNLPLLWYTP